MELREPYGTGRLYWDDDQNRLLDQRDWGYVTKEGMVVLNVHGSNNPTLRNIFRRELGIDIFNGECRPAYLRAWTESGAEVKWSELRNTWMLYDLEHHIILPEPTYSAPVVYPHPDACPYVMGAPRHRYSAHGEFILTKANRKRAEQYIEFFKLIVMKGRMAGRPKAVRSMDTRQLGEDLSQAPNLEAVSVEKCRQIVWGLGLENTIPPGILNGVRYLSRDTETSRYLSTWSKGREP